MKNLREYLTQKMSANVRSRIFCLSFVIKNHEKKRTIILLIVLCRCATWSLTLWVEHKLWVFEGRVVRKIFKSRREKVTGDWRKLQWEVSWLVFVIFGVMKSDKLRGTQCVAGVKESKCAYRDLVEKRQVRTPLRRSRLYSILILKGV